MQIEVARIKVRKLIRSDNEDISSLADSLNRYGQLQPIIVTRKNVLVAGGRRLEAARMLGWKTINAIVDSRTDELSTLELEVEENLQRVPLSREDMEAAFSRMERLRNPGFFRRILKAIVSFVKKLFRLEDN